MSKTRHSLAYFGLGVALLILLSPASAAAVQTAPQIVSPGEPGQTVEVASACPTFSWTTAPGAVSIELVVYALPEGVEASELPAEPVLTRELPAGANSWTPAKAQCLAAGQSYAWSVGARSQDEEPAWSDIRVFEVAEVAERSEVEEALERVLTRFLEQRRIDEATVTALRRNPELMMGDGSPGPLTPVLPAADPQTAIDAELNGTGVLATIRGIMSGTTAGSSAVRGEATESGDLVVTYGVAGTTRGQGDGAAGVLGEGPQFEASANRATYGVRGLSESTNNAAAGVRGEGSKGVLGVGDTSSGGIGVIGAVANLDGLNAPNSASNINFFSQYTGYTTPSRVGVLGLSAAASGTGGDFRNLDPSETGVGLSAQGGANGADVKLKHGRMRLGTAGSTFKFFESNGITPAAIEFDSSAFLKANESDVFETGNDLTIEGSLAINGALVLGTNSITGAGNNSGLNADTVDGIQGNEFARNPATVDLNMNTQDIVSINALRFDGGATLTGADLTRLTGGSDASSAVELHHHNTRYLNETELASTSGTSGADLIGLKDTAGLIAATSVEAALAELAMPGGSNQPLQEAYEDGNSIAASSGEGELTFSDGEAGAFSTLSLAKTAGVTGTASVLEIDSGSTDTTGTLTGIDLKFLDTDNGTGVRKGIDISMPLSTDDAITTGAKITAGGGFVGTATNASDVTCTSCISESELGFSTATQAELDAHNHASLYYLKTEIGSTSGTSGAELVGIKDTGGLFTAANIEGALAELASGGGVDQSLQDAYDDGQTIAVTAAKGEFIVNDAQTGSFSTLTLNKTGNVSTPASVLEINVLGSNTLSTLTGLALDFDDTNPASGIRKGLDIQMPLGTDDAVTTNATITANDFSCNGCVDLSGETNLTVSAPIVLTGDDLSLTQGAGTDVTGDLEEETHGSEHNSGGDDPITSLSFAAITAGATTSGLMVGVGGSIVPAGGSITATSVPATGVTGIGAGTDLAMDLEEEAHGSEHRSGAADPVALTASASLDFAGGTRCELETLTLTGAATSDLVLLGPPSGLGADVLLTGWVSAANTVSVRACKIPGNLGTSDADGTYTVGVI